MCVGLIVFFFIFIEEEFVLWILIFPFLSAQYNRNLGFLLRDVVSLRCRPSSKHLLFLPSSQSLNPKSVSVLYHTHPILI